MSPVRSERDFHCADLDILATPHVDSNFGSTRLETLSALQDEHHGQRSVGQRRRRVLAHGPFNDAFTRENGLE